MLLLLRIDHQNYQQIILDTSGENVKKNPNKSNAMIIYQPIQHAKQFITHMDNSGKVPKFDFDVNPNRVPFPREADQVPFPRESDPVPFRRETDQVPFPRETEQMPLSGNQPTTPRSRSAYY